MKDDFGRDIICESTGKICYNAKEAGVALNRAKKHYHSDEESSASKKIPKRKYYCEKCGHYHLTSQSAPYNKREKQEKYRYKKEKLRKRENKYDWREECSLLYVA